jgi:alginate O-acetyltransferase complex protein AlgI
VLFNDLDFLFLFLPATAVATIVMPRRWRTQVLLLASLVFYGFSGIGHLTLLVISILWVYGVTSLRHYAGSPLLLILAISLPFAFLLAFKYWLFIAQDVLGLTVASFGSLPVFADPALPAGISFFTFHLISYAVDRSEGQIPQRPGFTAFATYVAFFPQLVAGPITRWREVGDQIRAIPWFRLDWTQADIGLRFVVIGYAFKVILADGLSAATAPLMAADSLHAFDLAYLMLGYSFRIYFDFCGYSLIAIGLARMFGVVLPRNFAMPYRALNPREFWRRWHMTLSFWLRDYLYIRLGGNRRYVRNILITFLLCGLWHGAGFQFIAWGGYHALGVLAYHALRKHWDRLPRLLQWLVTFVFVSIGWLLFIYDLPTLATLLDGLAAGPVDDLQVTGAMLAWLAAAAVVCLAIDPDRLAGAKAPHTARAVAGGICYGVLMIAALVLIDRSEAFIYFRF